MAGIDYVITTTRTFTDMDGIGTDYYVDASVPANSDSLTINSGGNVTDDLSMGGIGSRAITVNEGGKLIINAGISLLFADGNKFLCLEGGQIISRGTVGSRVTITGGSQTTTTNYFACTTGGKIYLENTDVSYFYIFGQATVAGVDYNIQLVDSTLDYIGFIRSVSFVGAFELYNCRVTQRTAARYVFYYVGLFAVNADFISVTDNLLAVASTTVKFSFAGCSYDGGGGALPINSDDFGVVTQDIDIRIYEASTVTVAGNLAGVSLSPDHPSLDSLGMLYDDDTFYMKIPGYLSCDQTNASGISTLYLLQKSAYWPSGLAVGSRTWKYWSDSGQAETGDNQKWTVTMAKSGYVTDTDTDWAGNAMTGTLDPVVAGGGGILLSNRFIGG